MQQYLLSVLAQWGATLVKRKKGGGVLQVPEPFTALSVVRPCTRRAAYLFHLVVAYVRPT